MLQPARLLLAALVALLAAGCATPAPTSADQGHRTALLQVVEAFRLAILNKDKPAFMALFHAAEPERITWQAVVDDPSLAVIRRSRPEAIRARYRPDNNFVAFIDGIVASNSREEETFAEVVIDTDGEIASVSFDYVYLSNAQPTNRGREKWLLVRTEQGWKITAVVYTIRLPAAPTGRP